MAPSAPPRHVFVENVGGGVALISLYRPPVNAMNGAVWEQLLAALSACEAAAADGRPPPVTPPLPPGASRAAFPAPDANAAASPTRAIIFTSALPRPIFTAGNDISELHVPSTSRTRFDAFWVTSATFLARLYASPLHTVAAVAGACPAGGTALALACDERVAAAGGGTALGLNEVALGIPVPTMWARLLARVVGWAPAEALVRGGVMLPAAAAAKTGLVDELVDPGAPAERRGAGEAVVTAALRRARWQLRLADPGRVATKGALRRAFAAEWAVDAPADASRVWGLLTQPAVVATLGRVLAQLAGRKGDARRRGKL